LSTEPALSLSRRFAVAAALITWTDVTNLDSTLSAVPALSQTAILMYVTLQVDAAEWGDMAAMGQAFLAAHYGLLRLREGDIAGPISSESVGSVSVGYGQLVGVTNDEVSSTPWGREYRRVRRLLVCTFGAVVC
jgi:hypothetical protein